MNNNLSTKFIIVQCPGNKVPIRAEPNVEEQPTGYATSGSRFEIYTKPIAGFWKIYGDKGYMNKSTKNVEWIDVVCPCCGCGISRQSYYKVNVDLVFSKTDILCEAHFIKAYALSGIIKFQAVGHGYYVRVRKDIVKREKIHMKELMRKLPRIVDNHNKKSINYDSLAFNVYAEFPEFSKQQLDNYTELFNAYDLDKTGKITVDGLAKLMEKLKVPQTHLQLKMLIKEVDTDGDNTISLKEFVTLFRRRAKGELMSTAAAQMVNIFNESCNVNKVGVTGAKAFFETKTIFNKRDMHISEVQIHKEQRAVLREEKQLKKVEFEQKKALFVQKSTSEKSLSTVSTTARTNSDS